MATTDDDAGARRHAPAGPAMTVRLHVRLLSGPAGRTVAGAQGAALVDVLAFLGPPEVGGSEEEEQ